MKERLMKPPEESFAIDETKKINKAKPPTPDQDKSDLQTIYRNEMQKYQLLTPAEEKELARRIQKGDKEALDLLVNSNLRLVIAIAYELTYEKDLIPDLIQEGNLGLIKAAEKFDPDKGAKFSTYAAPWIEVYMKNYIRAIKSLIKIGTTQKQRTIFSNIIKIERKLEHEGVETTDENVAARMKEAVGVNADKVTAKDIHDMRLRLKPLLSIDASISSDDNAPTLGDYLKSTAISPEEAAQKKEVINSVREAVDSITDKRDRAIIQERLLGDKADMTLTEIGKKFGVSRERIRQLEVLIKKRLAAILERKGMQDY